MEKARVRSYEIDMCNGPILSKLLRIAIPLTCSAILQLLFNAADIVVLGRYAGDNSMGAVGSTASFVGLLTNLLMGLSTGANILASRNYGAKNGPALHRTVHTAIPLSLLSGFFMGLVGVVIAPTVLTWMQCPPNLISLATLYLRIYFLGLPASMLYNFSAALLRAVGDTRRPLYFLMVSGVVNVVLNLFFVIVCRLDVAGVAIATVISQCISALLVLRCLMREQGSVRLELQKMRFHKDTLLGILEVGLPAGLQGVLFSLSNMVIQSSVNLFGETIIAANSAANSIDSFIYSVGNSFAQTNASFTSQNYGARKYGRIVRICLTTIGALVVAQIILCGSVIIFAPQLVRIYSSTPAVIAAATEKLRILCFFYPFMGTVDILVGSMRGIGHNLVPMLVSLGGICGIRLLWIATAFQVPALHQVETVYWSYPISWVTTAIIHATCFVISLRHLRRQWDQEDLLAAAQDRAAQTEG